MKDPFNFQSKKNTYTFICMWFIGFMVKDTAAGIVPMSSFRIMSPALRRASSIFRIADPKI